MNNRDNSKNLNDSDDRLVKLIDELDDMEREMNAGDKIESISGEYLKQESLDLLTNIVKSNLPTDAVDIKKKAGCGEL